MTRRRTHSPEFKQSAVAASNQPGASIAGVAMAHEINANQLHKWRRQLLAPKATVIQAALLPVTMLEASEPDPLMPPEGRIDIRFPRSRLSIYGQVDPVVLQTVLAALKPR